jgi:hypothetical protein
MKQRTTEEIARAARDGDAIDRALAVAYRRTVLRHRRLGAPLVVWQDGRVVEVSADSVALPDVDDAAEAPGTETDRTPGGSSDPRR